MGLNAVETWARTLVTGVTSPLYQTALQAYTTPPNPGKLVGPAAYVWATSGPNRRQTAPRGHGFRKTSWIITVWLMAVGKATDPKASQPFNCLVDAVVEAWVTAEIPFFYTTPYTTRVSQILDPGEMFAIEKSPLHTLADQRLVLYEALIRFTINEALVP